MNGNKKTPKNVGIMSDSPVSVGVRPLIRWTINGYTNTEVNNPKPPTRVKIELIVKVLFWKILRFTTGDLVLSSRKIKPTRLMRKIPMEILIILESNHPSASPFSKIN